MGDRCPADSRPETDQILSLRTAAEHQPVSLSWLEAGCGELDIIAIQDHPRRPRVGEVLERGPRAAAARLAGGISRDGRVGSQRAEAERQATLSMVIPLVPL